VYISKMIGKNPGEKTKEPNSHFESKTPRKKVAVTNYHSDTNWVPDSQLFRIAERQGRMYGFRKVKKIKKVSSSQRR